MLIGSGVDAGHARFKCRDDMVIAGKRGGVRLVLVLPPAMDRHRGHPDQASDANIFRRTQALFPIREDLAHRLVELVGAHAIRGLVLFEQLACLRHDFL